MREQYHTVQPVTVNYSGEYATVVPVAGGQVTYDPSATYGGGYSPLEYQKTSKGRGIVTTRFNPIARPIGQIGGPIGQIGGQIGSAAISMGLTTVQEGPATTIFAYNIGPNATEADMYGLFSKYGRITKVDVIHGKGYGFVHMPVAYEANEAVRVLNGAYYNGKYLQVSIKHKK